MYAKLVIVAAVIAALSATHWKAYKQGEKATRADWAAEKIETLKLARQRDEALRATKEKALEQQKKSLIQNAAAADRARASAERMRNTSEQSLAAARESHAACVVSASTHAELFDLCQREYRGMAKNADGHATDIKALIESWQK